MIFRRFHSALRFIENEIYKQPVPRASDTIIVAMSGGVDSSVCAGLYSKNYRNVRGIFMQNWSTESSCTERDWNEVKGVAEHLDIPCDRVNFEREYWENVFTPMIDGYKNGMTPNPDVSCNKHIKFGRLIELLNDKYGVDNPNWWIVTGHYARILTHRSSGEQHLLRGVYAQKDQSFYLSSLPPSSLKRILLPIGHYIKPDVRAIAKEMKLPTADKPDSQGLCFVSQKGNFRTFLNEYIEPNPGNIITEDGTVHGQHGGLWHATVGQKCGISMPQGNLEFEGKWFVSEKRYDTNELVIVKGGDNPKLYKDYIEAQRWEWFADMSEVSLPPVDEITVQFRSLQTALRVASVGFNDSTVSVELVSEAKGIAPGQVLVLYHGDRVLGSGVISLASRKQDESGVAEIQAAFA